jgi:hypothetical protein
MAYIDIPNQPGWEYNDAPADPAATITSGSFAIGTRYKITNLSGTSAAQWHTAAGTQSTDSSAALYHADYVVGDTFKAAAEGAGTGKVVLADSSSRELWLKSTAGVRGQPGTDRRKVENHIKYSEDLTNNLWVRQNMTIASGASDPLGGLTAYTITATASNATWLQTVTPPLTVDGETAVSTTFSIWIKKRDSAAGAANIVQADGSLGIVYTAFNSANTSASGWQRVQGVYKPAAFTGEATVGVKIPDSGGSYDIWHPQFEAVSNAFPPREDRHTYPATLANSEGLLSTVWTNENLQTFFKNDIRLRTDVSEYVPSVGDGVGIQYFDNTSPWINVDSSWYIAPLRALKEVKFGIFGQSKLVPLQVYIEARKKATAVASGDQITRSTGELNKTYSDGLDTEDSEFRMVITTTGSNETMTIPMATGSATLTPNCTINWGDGTTTTSTTRNGAGMSHVYASAGDYTISISGSLPCITFGDDDATAFAAKIKKVLNFGELGWIELGSAFGNCTNMTSFNLGNFNSMSVTRANSMFDTCTSLVEIDMTDFVNVTCNRVDGMFRGCTALKKATLIGWDSRTILGLKNFCRGCQSLESLPGIENLSIAGFDVTKTNSFSNFISGGTGKMTPDEYDALLINFALQDLVLENGVVLDPCKFGESVSSETLPAAAAVVAAKDALIGTPVGAVANALNKRGWVINDGN